METVFQFLCKKILLGHSNSDISSVALISKIADGIPSVQIQLKLTNLAN